MPVQVAEYLGIRTDSAVNIVPVAELHTKPDVPCPFRNDKCLKVMKGQHPVCSVRNSSGDLWVVCEHRLCATQPKKSNLNAHQQKILTMVAKTIYYESIQASQILVKREESIPITASSRYKADYVMALQNGTNDDSIHSTRAIVEMQGGGETAQTEKLTAVVSQWSASPIRTNAMLAAFANATPLETNAWRRQQEQFLVKGNVAVLTGAKMVFCVGPLIYDYLIQRITTVNIQDLRSSNWTLALLAFKEDPTGAVPACAPHSIQFCIDKARSLFTNYFSFVQALTNQGAPQPQVFRGKFMSIDGTWKTIP